MKATPTRRTTRALAAVAGGALVMGSGGLAVPASADVAENLTGPRGVATAGKKLIVSEADGTISRINRKTGKKTLLTQVPENYVAPAIAGEKGKVHILTAGGEDPGAATLYRYTFKNRKLVKVRNIMKYQAKHPDPFDLEDHPEESNPYGLAAVGDGSVLVADAAGNDLLRVWPRGRTRTVAELKPRVVAAGDMGDEGPPPGTMMPAEAVATSVAVGQDGFWYVGELRGYPATPGTSQLWRIKPGTKNAVCRPNKPQKGDCKRAADGFTSIVGLARGPRRTILVVEFAKDGWYAAETTGSTEGSLLKVRRGGERKELLAGQLNVPGGAATDRTGRIYVSDWSIGHFFGQPGSLKQAN